MHIDFPWQRSSPGSSSGSTLRARASAGARERQGEAEPLAPGSDGTIPVPAASDSASNSGRDVLGIPNNVHRPSYEIAFSGIPRLPELDDITIVSPPAWWIAAKPRAPSSKE